MSTSVFVTTLLCLVTIQAIQVEAEYTPSECLFECNKCMMATSEDKVEEHCGLCWSKCKGPFFQNIAGCKLYAGTSNCTQYCKPCSELNTNVIEELFAAYSEEQRTIVHRLRSMIDYITTAIEDKCGDILYGICKGY